MKRILSTAAAMLILAASLFILNFSNLTRAEAGSEPQGEFTFAFLADIHLQPELEAGKGFRKAIDMVNKLKKC